MESTTIVIGSADPSSNGVEHDSKSGMELESESDKSPTTGQKLLSSDVAKVDEPQPITSTLAESKRTRKKGGKKSTKLPNGSSTTSQDISSSSLTSLKGNRSGKNRHRAVKKSSKRHIKT